MLIPRKRLAFVSIVGVAALTLFASLAQAQWGRAVDPRVQQAAGNVGGLAAAAMGANPYGILSNPGAAGAAASPYLAYAAMTSNQYPSQSGYGSGYGGYGYPMIPDPLQGYLTGSAAVIDSQGRYFKSRQETAILRELAHQAQLETRKKTLDTFLYIRANTPTMQDDRERNLALDLRRSQLTPSYAEILSGQALNLLLDHAARLQGKGVRGPTAPLDEDLLKRINVSTATGGNFGLLKRQGELTLPEAFLGQTYEQERRHLKEVVPTLVKEADAGKVDPALLASASNDVQQLRSQLARDSYDLSPNQYIAALRFLRQLDDGIRGLRDPDAGKFLKGVYAAKGKNAAELVKNMAESGLRFGPAVAGDEAAYLAVYHALSSYDVALQEVKE